MTIATLLDMAASGFPDRVSVGPLSGGMTFAETARRAAGGATILRGTGAAHVVFIGTNGPAFPTLIFASAIAGIPIAPLSYRLSATQLSHLIESLDEPLVVADAQYLDAVDALNVIPTDEWFAQTAESPPAEPADVADDPPGIILFTSGTSSAAKAVVLRHSNLFSYVVQTVEFGSAADEEAALVSVPPYHIAGCSAVLTNMYAGRRVVYLPDFSPQRWLDLVRDEKVTRAMVVPTMLARVVQHLGDRPADVPSLRSIAYGGAPMPRSILERALELFYDAGFVNAYGLSETSSTIALLGPEDHRAAVASDDPVVRARLSSTGRLIPSVEGQIRDTGGKTLPPGEVGELWVRGPQVSGEYRGVGSVLDSDGWFPTRDRARFDDEGYLFIEGRGEETIIRGGENIAPAEIEEVLLTHPGVREVAVVGVPDDEWGERIVAVLVPVEGAQPSVDEIRTWVRARLRGSRTPDDVFFRDELPRTDKGTVIRRDVVARLTDAAYR